MQALTFIGHRVTAVRESNANAKQSFKKPSSPVAEAVEVLANLVLNHVPVHQYNFRGKIIYVTHIIRRVLRTVRDRSLLDDKVTTALTTLTTGNSPERCRYLALRITTVISVWSWPAR